MKLIVTQTETLKGDITIPGSKSHTIRAVLIASLAEGISTLKNPLFSEDVKAAMNAAKAMGAHIEQKDDLLIIEGFGGRPKPPTAPIDMLNSGTSTNLFLGVLAALGVEAEVTGDASLCSRPVSALTDALAEMGCRIEFLDRQGCPPLRISGRMRGGAVGLDASKSSQYVSSLLLSCPLLDRDTDIQVKNPTELPYIEMTLKWLDEQDIRYERDGFSRFKIFGGQGYVAFEKAIPSDWSSATFPICAAAVTHSEVLVKGVDINDVQGDKAILDYLKDMGADIQIENTGIRVIGSPLTGRAIDMNATPDALPALAVVGCMASGTTTLHNVAQARVKETDRISVMAQELEKMNAQIQALSDGLVIRKSDLKGGPVNGYHDHRVVMALSIAAMAAQGRTTIDSAEAVSVTYPGYIETMQQLGAKFEVNNPTN